MASSRPLLIAVGNRWRRDDGVAAMVVERLAARFGDAVDAILLPGEGAGLIEAWRGCEVAWLFDAASASGNPGRVTRIEAAADPVPAGLCHHSTHRFGVAEAIEMARVLGCLPRRLVLVAIEGTDFGEGVGLSPALASRVDATVAAVAVDIAAALPPCDGAP